MGLVPNPMQPDDVFDLIDRPVDDRIVARMGEIRDALLAEDFSGNPDTGAHAEILACAMQVLAFLWTPLDQAVELARDLSVQMAGQQNEVGRRIGAHFVSFGPYEPSGMYGTIMAMMIDGEQVASVEYCCTDLEDLDVKWPVLFAIADRVLCGETGRRPAI